MENLVGSFKKLERQKSYWAGGCPKLAGTADSHRASFISIVSIKIHLDPSATVPSLFQLFLSSVTEWLSKLVFFFQTVNFSPPHPHTKPKTGGTSDSGSDLQRSYKANSD